MEKENGLEAVWRKSNQKEDADNATKVLQRFIDINPYTFEEVAQVIRAGVRSGELALEKKGRSYCITDLLDWFRMRVQPATVTLDKDDYMVALLNSLVVLTQGNIAKTDFGGSRQREFGQMWTDFLRGYLGEIAIRIFLRKHFGIEVQLDQSKTGAGVEKYLPTDIVKIKKEGKWVDVKHTLSIKTSKLRSLWLGVPGNQIDNSDAFAYVKIGIPLDHLATLLKEVGAIEQIFEYKDKTDIEATVEEIKNKIPSFKPIPAYLPGYIYRNDLKSGELELHRAEKYLYIIGGAGKQPEDAPEGFSGIKVEGLGEASEEYLASCGSLKCSTDEWKEIIARF